VEAIGRNSNLAHLSRKWSDLLERIAALPARGSLSADQSLPRRHKRSLSAEDTADIIAKYNSGITTTDLGAMYHVSKSRISAVLREEGATIRRQGLTDEQAREAATFYNVGRSLAWIAARYGGISPTTVARALRRQGIHLRPRPGRLFD
jgi:hypothetical protein